jgi:hypothetical protein
MATIADSINAGIDKVFVGIYGYDHPKFTHMGKALFILTLMVMIGLVIFLSYRAVAKLSGKSPFENYPNNIRRYIVSGEASLDDKMYKAQKSTLTGSRDAPVFFSDYGVQMSKEEDGALVQEGFDNNELSNIESRFMLK